MKTKFGNAKIDKGYYRITSRKEGNNGKFLHRLIWEDFWKAEVPKGYVIHHRNFNKLDNCILNLQLMRDKDHRILHNICENNPMYGKNLSERHKINLSKSRNTSGYLNVCKDKDKRFKQGFIWCYQYFEDGKHIKIRSVDINKLEAKVKAKGLLWKEFKNGGDVE